LFSKLQLIFSLIDIKFHSKLVGGFVGFCARKFTLFHHVPSFDEELKNIMKIALKALKWDKEKTQLGTSLHTHNLKVVGSNPAPATNLRP